MKILLEKFPEEILVEILSHVEIFDLMHLSRCSQHLRRLSAHVYLQRQYSIPFLKSLEPINSIQPPPFAKQIYSLTRKRIRFEVCVMLINVNKNTFVFVGTEHGGNFFNCNPKLKISILDGFFRRSKTLCPFDDIVVDELITYQVNQINRISSLYGNLEHARSLLVNQINHIFPMYGNLEYAIFTVNDFLQGKRHFAPLTKEVVAVDSEKNLQIFLNAMDTYSAEHYQESCQVVYQKEKFTQYYPLF